MTNKSFCLTGIHRCLGSTCEQVQTAVVHVTPVHLIRTASLTSCARERHRRLKASLSCLLNPEQLSKPSHLMKSVADRKNPAIISGKGWQQHLACLCLLRLRRFCCIGGCFNCCWRCRGNSGRPLDQGNGHAGSSWDSQGSSA